MCLEGKIMKSAFGRILLCVLMLCVLMVSVASAASLEDRKAEVREKTVATLNKLYEKIFTVDIYSYNHNLGICFLFKTH